MYNSRSSQLVLGAGSVVLKKIQSITAKNLCLLSLIVLLIEKSLIQIDTCLNQKKYDLSNIEMNKQKLENGIKDLHNHFKELQNKLVIIMKC